jgi:hypothetical protein
MAAMAERAICRTFDLSCQFGGPQQPFNQFPRIAHCRFVALTVLDDFGAGIVVSGKELFGNIIKLPLESTTQQIQWLVPVQHITVSGIVWTQRGSIDHCHIGHCLVD